MYMAISIMSEVPHQVNGLFSTAHRRFCAGWVCGQRSIFQEKIPRYVPLCVSDIILAYLAPDKISFASTVFMHDRRITQWRILDLGNGFVCILAPYAHRRPLSERSIRASLDELDMITELVKREDINKLDCVSHLAEYARHQDFDCTTPRAIRMRELQEKKTQIRLAINIAAAIIELCTTVE